MAELLRLMFSRFVKVLTVSTSKSATYHSPSRPGRPRSPAPGYSGRRPGCTCRGRPGGCGTGTRPRDTLAAEQPEVWLKL